MTLKFKAVSKFHIRLEPPDLAGLEQTLESLCPQLIGKPVQSGCQDGTHKRLSSKD